MTAAAPQGPPVDEAFGIEESGVEWRYGGPAEARAAAMLVDSEIGESIEARLKAEAGPGHWPDFVGFEVALEGGGFQYFWGRPDHIEARGQDYFLVLGGIDGLKKRRATKRPRREA